MFTLVYLFYLFGIITTIKTTTTVDTGRAREPSISVQKKGQHSDAPLINYSIAIEMAWPFCLPKGGLLYCNCVLTIMTPNESFEEKHFQLLIFQTFIIGLKCLF